MVRIHPSLAVVLVALALPSVAAARSWQGITPGSSTQADVVARFGEPSTKGKLEGRTALVYRGEQAIVGTRQAQFLVGDDGIVAEINVFPAAALDKDAVLGTYGNDPQKTFTDEFRPVWTYRSIGVKVFFGKDGSVEAIRFQAAERGARQPAAPAQAPSSAPSSATDLPAPARGAPAAGR